MAGRDTHSAGGPVGDDDGAALPAGTVIDGRYRLIAEIGAGAMGRVYEAEHMFLRRRIALKLLRGGAGRTEAAARMVQEATLAGQVPHPAIVRVLDCADLGAGRVYLAMELLRGESLEQALRRPGNAAEIVPWLADVARGLAAAHRVGVVHRDVKPANIFLARDAAGAVQAKLLDFGVAKLLPGAAGAGEEGVQTQAGAVLGTPYYLAPEQARGAALDGRADLYSLGVILYEVLTGELPFVGDSFMAILAQHLRTPPLDPRQAAPARAIPDAAARLTMRLLAKDPAARAVDGDEVADAIAAVLAAEREALARLVTGGGGGEVGTVRLAEASGAGTVRLAEASGAGTVRLVDGTGDVSEGTGSVRLAEGAGEVSEGTGSARLAEGTGHGSERAGFVRSAGGTGLVGAGPVRVAEGAGSARLAEGTGSQGSRRWFVAVIAAAIASAVIGWAAVRAMRRGEPAGVEGVRGSGDAVGTRGAGGEVEARAVTGSAVQAGDAGAATGAAEGTGAAGVVAAGSGASGAAETGAAGSGASRAVETGAAGVVAAGAAETGGGAKAVVRPEKPARGGTAGKKSSRDGGTTRTPPAPDRAGDPPLKPDVYDE